jgi:hypothetical protein
MAVAPSGRDKLERYTRLYIGGYDLSGDSRSFSAAVSAFNPVDMTGWSELVRNYMADGYLQAGLTGYQALMNDATGRAFEQLQLAADSISSQLSLCFGGGGEPAVGDPAYVLPSVQMNDLIGFDSNAAVLSGIDFMLDATQYTANVAKVLGHVMRGPTSLSATLTASSANTVDGGAQSTDGFIAILHILATASGNFAFTLKDSADDSAFATLGTFTLDGSAIGSEIITGSGTVDQYVGFDAQRTAGTCTAICTFVRN